MNIINSVTDKRFSINNVQYLKNYVSAVYGNKIEIFNCYERGDVLVPLTHYSNFMVNGVLYPNATDLQATLLPVLYSRANLGGATPDIDQDNIDVVQRIRCESASAENVLAAINSLEMYGIDAKQSLWFLVLVPGGDTLNGRLSNPVMYKYKMVNYGKGTYGAGAFPLGLIDIELAFAAKATANDIANYAGTQVITFGSITTTVSSWLRQNPREIQPVSQGYTLFKGTVNGIESTYLWVGSTSSTNAIQTDFLLLDEVIIAADQDNIDIKKTFNIGLSNSITAILNILNNLPAYTVSEKQSVWFVSRPFRENNVGENNPNELTNHILVKYKMINKGKGTYGLGHTQLSTSDIELVYSNIASLNDVETAAGTAIVPFTLSAGQSVSQWLNSQVSPIEIQPQEQGYTIFKSTVEDGLSYLWIGASGAYGDGFDEAALEDFQLLNENIIPVNQDNTDIKKSFPIPHNYTATSILSRINSLMLYEITETQSVWFVAHQQLSEEGTDSANGLNPIVLKYKMLNRGKGWYGQNGIQLTANDIELVYVNEATLPEMEQAPGTNIINITLSAGETINEWLNTQSPPRVIQHQADGYTVFKEGGQPQAWLWTGMGGTYGIGELQSSGPDFQSVNDVAPAPFVPTLNQAAQAGNTIYDTPVTFSDPAERLTVSAQGIEHTKADKLNRIRFEAGGLEGNTTITLTIPAKTADDVFAMVSDLHKPVKNVTVNSTGFESGTYTLQPEDRDKWLLFTIPSDFIISIPQATFSPYTLIEGETADEGQATFVANGGITLHFGASELPKTAEMNSVFGLKFRTAADVSLFGKLALL